MMKKIYIKLITIFTVLISTSGLAIAKDAINRFALPEQAHALQTITIAVNVDVSKQRELFVTLQDTTNWKTLKTLKKRIKQSGDYQFAYQVPELAEGRYRWNAYLAPRGKKWADRVSEFEPQYLMITDKAALAKVAPVKATSTSKVNLGEKIDLVTQVNWPKTIADDATHTLKVHYKVHQPRTLHIRLTNSENWQELGELSVPVTKPGAFEMPFEALQSNFGQGKYAWIIDIQDSAKKNSVLSKKFGKHFVIDNLSMEK
ncbi:hypothetical protein [Thalassotalea sp. PLHSN55]|uniref:hypothetical protein n=1 Tax=Thalassotalea sp. PLHSN55 TaxID=3435888 RepID=UPI003F83D3F4